MLTITTLADAEYLLRQVAIGVEDYYMGSGEAPKPQESPKVATASGGLAADIAALQSALVTLRNVEPVMQRVLMRLAKLSEVL